jgi:hypothetical protein
MPGTIKVSQFPTATNARPGDIVTGLRNGVNTNFNLNSGASGAGVSKIVSQNSHGFTKGQAVRLNAGTYVLALADSAENAEALGLVTEIQDPNTFTFQQVGPVTDLDDPAFTGFPPGLVYFLSSTTPGELTTTEPSTDGEVSKPMFVSGTDGTSGTILSMRGQVIAGAPPTQQEEIENILVREVTQVGHGLLVGNWVRMNGANYVKATATSLDDSQVVGLVTSVNGNVFTVQSAGFIAGIFAGLTPGGAYYLSVSTAGGMTLTEPTTIGEWSKPVFVATSSTDGYIQEQRGWEVGDSGGGGGSGGGNWVQVASVTATVDATVDLVGVFSSNYTDYMIVGKNITFQNDGDDFRMIVGTGATPTWKTGGSDYSYSSDGHSSDNDTAIFNSNASAFIELANNVNNSSTAQTCFVIRCFSPAVSTTQTAFLGEVNSSWSGGSSQIAVNSHASTYQNVEAISSLRFSASSGDINDGVFEVYGFNPSPGSGGGGSERIVNTITQNNHNLNIRDWVRIDNTTGNYVKAQANTFVRSLTVGMVIAKIDDDNFVLQTAGYLPAGIVSSLSMGELYYLSPTVEGGMTNVAPVTDGQVSRPVFMPNSATTGYVLEERSLVLPFGGGSSGSGGAPNLVQTVYVNNTGSGIAINGDFNSSSDVVITPSSTASRIKISLSGNGLLGIGGNNQVLLKRNGSLIPLSSGYASLGGCSGSGSNNGPFGVYVDSPALNTPVTYSLYMGNVRTGAPASSNFSAENSVVLIAEEVTGSSGGIAGNVVVNNFTTSVNTSISGEDIPGLFLKITPSSATSRVKISLNSDRNFGYSAGLILKQKRNGVVLTSGGYEVSSGKPGSTNVRNIQFVDSPATTSEVTYQIYATTTAVFPADAFASPICFTAEEIGAAP